MKKNIILAAVVGVALVVSLGVILFVRQQKPEISQIKLPVLYENYGFSMSMPEGWYLEGDSDVSIASFSSPKLRANYEAAKAHGGVIEGPAYSMLLTRFESLKEFGDTISGNPHPDFVSLAHAANWFVNEMNKDPNFTRETDFILHANFAGYYGYEVIVGGAGMSHGVVFMEDGKVYRILFDGSELADPYKLSERERAILNSIRIDKTKI